jgi:hypothetical protein
MSETNAPMPENDPSVPETSPPMVEDSSPIADRGYLLFVWKPSGYELEQRSGEPPSVGDDVEVGDVTQRVGKIAPSPLPGDSRLCAYLQPVK